MRGLLLSIRLNVGISLESRHVYSTVAASLTMMMTYLCGEHEIGAMGASCTYGTLCWLIDTVTSPASAVECLARCWEMLHFHAPTISHSAVIIISA